MSAYKRWLSIAFFAGGAVHAATTPSELRFDDYLRTTWTTKEGAPASVSNMAQSPDGWLWLATKANLYRFDGLTFEQYTPPKGKLLTSKVAVVYAAENGDVWLGNDTGGVSVVRKSGDLEHFSCDNEAAGVAAIAVDTDQSVWIAASGGLAHLVNGRCELINNGAEFPLSVAQDVVLDQYGQLWVVGPDRVFLYDRKRGKFNPAGPRGTTFMTLGTDGRIWLGNSDTMVPVAMTQPLKPRPRDYVRRVSSFTGMFDSSGNYWSSSAGKGVRLVGNAATSTSPIAPNKSHSDKLDQAWQLSSLSVTTILEDREGNIWLGTQRGLERFSKKKIHRIPNDKWSGNCALALDLDGHVWASDFFSLATWKLPFRDAGRSPASQPYTSVGNGPDGSLILGAYGVIERRSRDGVVKLKLPGRPDHPSESGTVYTMLDDGRVLWASISNGVSVHGYVDRKWVPIEQFKDMPHDRTSVLGGRNGKIWLATTDGKINLYDVDHVAHTYRPDVGTITGFYDDGKEMLVGGNDGLAILTKDGYKKLRAAKAEAFHGVSGFTIAANGDHWFNAQGGVVRVSVADWNAGLRDESRAMAVQMFGVDDGYDGAPTVSMPSMITAGDGQIWFSTSSGLASIDPQALTTNKVAPTVLIKRLVSKTRSYLADQGLVLPPGTDSLNVDFTALSLTKPEKVSFQYQLAGIDSGWQDAGTRRSAYYTSLSPGRYRFRVKAANEDGVWSAQDAELEFVIKPTVTQTVWFKLLCAALLCLLAYLAYRAHLRVMTNRIADRMRARTSERERIAIELHDTVLQSMYGVIMHAENAAQTLDGQHESKERLTKAIDHANHAINEGRDRVQTLRHGSDDELVDMWADLVTREGASAPVRVVQQGASRGLHIVVKDELYVIGREALRNAMRHAGATEILMQLTYGAKELQLEIRDDGVGIPAEILAAGGRPGHLGLSAMCHRAEQIGGKCTIESRPGETVVRVVVPARLAYLAT